MNIEELIAAVIREEEEGDDLLVYCIFEGVTDILKKRKDTLPSTVLGDSALIQLLAWFVNNRKLRPVC